MARDYGSHAIGSAEFNRAFYKAMAPRVAKRMLRSKHRVKTTGEMDCATELAAHQEVVQELARVYDARGFPIPDKGMRGLLVYHGTGTGKTLSTAAIMLAFQRYWHLAEQAPDRVDIRANPSLEQFLPHIYLVSTPDNLKNNSPAKYVQLISTFFPRQLAALTPKTGAARQQWLFRKIGGNPQEPNDPYSKKDVPGSVVKRISFIMLANQLFTNQKTSQGLLQQEAFFRQPKVLIIDEVHNLAEYAKKNPESPMGKLYRWFVTDIAKSSNCIAFVLSATPGKSKSEWMDTLNIVRPVRAAPFQVSDVTQRPQRFRGLVSYIDLSSDPGRVAKVRQSRVFVELDDKYSVAYIDKYGADLGEKSKKTGQYEYDPSRPDVYLQTVRQLGDFLTPKQYGAWFDLKDFKDSKQVVPINNELHLASCKLLAVVSRVLASPGKQYVYSAFAQQHLAYLLNKNNLEELASGEHFLGTGTAESIVQRFFKYCRERKKHFFIKYAQFSAQTTSRGAETKETRDLAMAAFDHPDNSSGKYIKALLATGKNYEGLDLTGIMGVHIVEPMPNQLMLKQVIGRGARVCSHKHIKDPKDRIVRVFHYVAVPRTALAADAVDKMFPNSPAAKRAVWAQRLKSIAQVQTDKHQGGNMAATILGSSHAAESEMEQFANVMKGAAIDGPLFHHWYHQSGHKQAVARFNKGHSGPALRTMNDIYVVLGKRSKAPVAPRAVRNVSNGPLTVPASLFKVARVKGDGNCMFAAVATAYSFHKEGIERASQWQQRAAMKLREATYAWMEQHAKEMQAFLPALGYSPKTDVKTYIAHQRIALTNKNGTKTWPWASHMELAALQRLLGVKIQVWTRVGTDRFKQHGELMNRNASRTPVIHVLFEPQVHYDALLPRKGLRPASTRTVSNAGTRTVSNVGTRTVSNAGTRTVSNAGTRTVSNAGTRTVSNAGTRTVSNAGTRTISNASKAGNEGPRVPNALVPNDVKATMASVQQLAGAVQNAINKLNIATHVKKGTTNAIATLNKGRANNAANLVRKLQGLRDGHSDLATELQQGIAKLNKGRGDNAANLITRFQGLRNEHKRDATKVQQAIEQLSKGHHNSAAELTAMLQEVLDRDTATNSQSLRQYMTNSQLRHDKAQDKLYQRLSPDIAAILQAVRPSASALKLGATSVSLSRNRDRRLARLRSNIEAARGATPQPARIDLQTLRNRINQAIANDRTNRNAHMASLTAFVDSNAPEGNKAMARNIMARVHSDENQLRRNRKWVEKRLARPAPAASQSSGSATTEPRARAYLAPERPTPVKHRNAPDLTRHRLARESQLEVARRQAQAKEAMNAAKKAEEDLAAAQDAIRQAREKANQELQGLKDETQRHIDELKRAAEAQLAQASTTRDEAAAIRDAARREAVGIRAVATRAADALKAEAQAQVQRAMAERNKAVADKNKAAEDARAALAHSGYAAPGGHQRNTALAMLRLTEVPGVEVDNFAAWWDNQTSERQTAAWDLVNYLYLEHPTSMETYVHLQVTGKA
ncbi:hypothetical protein D9Q98_004054 [Chlorella vulgaris]|uniref:OTU domain-containing protein n=1 Tax=Chlorella vulgaris TaxID=3077 RepID=A0A9D4YY13_CHLVU|nr:hypothetical protein D9Q98_004054 [Chlorella vulgaris]